MMSESKSIKDIRSRSGMTQKELSEYLNIPKRTIEDWERGVAKCAPYLVDLIEYKLIQEKKI